MNCTLEPRTTTRYHNAPAVPLTAAQLAFAEWQHRYTALRQRVLRLRTSIHERGWKIAERADIPRDGCCLHNASIDEGLTGWCKGNPDRLRAAKQATHILNDWRADRILDALVARWWNRLLGAHGYRTYSEAEIAEKRREYNPCPDALRYVVVHALP